MIINQVNDLQNSQYVIFAVGREDYGLNIMDVKAIESYPNIKPVPNAPRNFLGVTSLRDEVIPVFSLSRKFGIEESINNNDKKVIITKLKDFVVAFVVDKIVGVMELLKEEHNQVPDILRTKDTSYLKWIAKKDGNLIFLLDQGNMLDRKEIEGIGKITDSI